MNGVIKRIAQISHVISAFWVLVIAVIILVDVLGRNFFNTPLLGAVEVIKNSVVSVTFLQIPLAIYRGGMLRTTLIYSHAPSGARRLMRLLANLLGAALFLGIAVSSWRPAFEALAIGEYEGEGALRVPTYPVRLLIIATSAYAAFIYAYLMALDLSGRLEESDAAEGAR